MPQILLRLAVFAASVFALSACTGGTEAPRDVVRGTGPDANGFVIVGAADENARVETFLNVTGFKLVLVRSDGRVESFARPGCATYAGLFNSCASDSKLAWQVLELPPGEWRIAGIHETILRGFPARRDDMDAKLPPGITLRVAPGEVVYAGDFTFGVNYDTRDARLKTYGRNDAGAQKALAKYPGLGGTFVYREPTHPVAGGN